ncbi:MAG: hypothetical protein CR988_06655 [Treponema sp.]|nr:MAG: hypothetical protein CR988_06655 [Treponema sp.]
MKQKRTTAIFMLILTVLSFISCNKNKAIKEQMLKAYKTTAHINVDNYYAFLQKACLIDFLKSGYTEHTIRFSNFSDFIKETDNNNNSKYPVNDITNSMDDLNFTLYSALSEKKAGMQFLISKGEKTIPFINFGTNAKNFLISTPFSKNQTFTLPTTIPGVSLPFSTFDLHKKLRNTGSSSKAGREKLKKKLDNLIDDVFKKGKVKKEKGIYICQFKGSEIKEMLKTAFNKNMAALAISKQLGPELENILSEIDENSNLILKTNVKGAAIESVEITGFQKNPESSNSEFTLNYNFKNNDNSFETVISTFSDEGKSEMLISKKADIYELFLKFVQDNSNTTLTGKIDFNKQKDNCKFEFASNLKRGELIKIIANGSFTELENEAKYVFPDIKYISDTAKKAVLHTRFTAVYSRSPAREIKFKENPESIILLAMSQKEKVEALTNELKVDLRRKLEELLQKDLSAYFK